MPAQPLVQYSATETYSKNILGPVFFEMMELQIGGNSTTPAAPSQSPYIIASDEQLSISVKIKFNKSPLTYLLMCLGTIVKVNFAFEGVGGLAAEVDLPVQITTAKDVYEYTITYTGTPSGAGLTSGFYAAAAVASVLPGSHPCNPGSPYGYGYIAGVLAQVY
jgi:hypothetical protein